MATMDGEVVLDAEERTASAHEVEQEVIDEVARMVRTRLITPQEKEK